MGQLTVDQRFDRNEGLLTQLIAHVAEVRQSNHRTELRLDQVEERMDARIDLMETRLGERLDRMETRLEGVETRLDGVETRLEGVETRLDGVETRLEGVETRLDGVETRLGGVETRLGGVETRLGGVETQLDGVETRLGALGAALQENTQFMRESILRIERTFEKFVETTAAEVTANRYRLQIESKERKLETAQLRERIAQFRPE